MTLIGKVALVTGAGSGIGRACALALSEAGASIVAANINAVAAVETAETIARGQRRAQCLHHGPDGGGLGPHPPC